MNYIQKYLQLMYVHTLTHTHTLTHIHTSTHTHIHTYIQALLWKRRERRGIGERGGQRWENKGVEEGREGRTRDECGKFGEWHWVGQCPEFPFPPIGCLLL